MPTRAQIVSGGAIINGESMAASITSDTVAMHGKNNVSFQIQAASGTHVGTMAIQGSNDGSNWIAITLSATPTASNGSAWQDLVNMTDIHAKYLRAVYTATSGTGTLYVYAKAK